MHTCIKRIKKFFAPFCTLSLVNGYNTWFLQGAKVVRRERIGANGVQKYKKGGLEMIIITEKSLINAENVVAFSVARSSYPLPGYTTTGYQLRAFHSGYTDIDGNGDYVLVKSYEEEQQAKADLEKILAAFLNTSGIEIVDLR